MQTTVNSPAVNIPAPVVATQKRRRFSSASYLRLERVLPVSQQEYEYLSAQCIEQRASGAKPKPDVDWTGASKAMLDQARQALESHNAELGWRCLNEARCYNIFGMAECNQEMLYSYAFSLYKESLAKLSGWRKETVVGLLAKDGKFDPSAKVESIVAAARILDEQQNSIFEKIALYERRLTFLTIATIVGLLAWIMISDLANVPRNIAWSSSKWVFWTMISIIGFMGSILSMFVTVVREQTSVRIPDMLSNLRVTIARMAIAPLAAVLAVILLSSGIINLGTVTLDLTIVIAIIAGFSEQLVVHTLQEFIKPGESAKETRPKEPSID